MESVGSGLRKIRLEKGITLEEAHKKTKIHIDVLKAIEDDTFVNLKPVYIKGFLKIYCKFLGVNPADYIDGYREPQTPVIAKPEERQGVIPSADFLKKPLLLQKIIFVSVSAIILILLIFGLIKFAKFVFSRISESNKKAKANVSSVVRQPKKTTVAKTGIKKSASTSPVVIDKGYESVVSKEGHLGIMLGISALDDCWMQLKVDGKTVFQNILKKGRVESWQAKDKIELSLGSAGSVQLEVNGKVIPVLGRKGQVLKTIVITKKDGLKVGK
jgi:cytoskeletal protein RodZ